MNLHPTLDRSAAAARPWVASPPVPGRPNPQPDPPHDPDDEDDLPDEEGDDEKRKPGRD